MIINHQKNVGLVLGLFLKLRMLICLARVRNQWEILIRYHRLREESLSDEHLTGRTASATYRPAGPRRGGHQRGALPNIDAELKH